MAVSITEVPKGHIGLGQLGVFFMVWTDGVGCGVEQRGNEVCRTGASNDGSAVGAVKLDGWLVFC